MIETQSITKTYRNGFAAVKGIDLQVGTGDIFGFLGPNRAGKTTTIRMLDGLLSPTAGKAYIDGIDIQKDPLAVKSIIGVVPESHGYYYWMTAKEYLQYFNSLFNRRENNDAYIEELLKKVGLSDKKDVPVGQFSRGMKQRLGIAKSLINRPKVIFLDEPTLGLDPRGQREIQQLLLDINQNDGITIFITSHMLKDIEVLCNTVSIVKDGQLVEQGSIKELQHKYMPSYVMQLHTGDDEVAKQLLSKLQFIQSVTEVENSLDLKFTEGLTGAEINEVKHQILREIFTVGIDVKEMTSKTLSMEDIFFKATEANAQ